MKYLSSVILALGMCACDASRTELLLVIDNAGLEIPREIDGLALEVRDMRDQTVFQLPQPIRPCHAGESPNGSPRCYEFPIVVKLIPGERAPTDQVRLRLDAVRGSARVLANTAVFYFAKGRTLRLDVVLYPECLGNLSCAEQNKLCAKNMMCVDAIATEVDPGTTDLAKRPPADLSPDLSVPSDLSLPPNPDFTAVPNDLTMAPPDFAGVDFLGCVPDCTGKECGPNGCGGECNPGCPQLSRQARQCTGSGMCENCGDLNQPCCGGTACANTGLRCETGTCVEACGQFGELCCSTGPECDPPWTCDKLSPQRCGAAPMDMSGYDMTPCGGPGEACCPIGQCYATNYLCNGQNICAFVPGMDMQVCGFDYGPCCGAVPYCNSLNFTCYLGMCQPLVMTSDMGVGGPTGPTGMK